MFSHVLFETVIVIVCVKLTLPYAKQIANRNVLYVSRNSNSGSVSTWRGGMGRKMKGTFKRKGYMYPAQAGIKIAGRNISYLRYADDTTLMAETREELKNLLRKVKEESEKVDLKLNVQKTRIMAFSPIISWQIDVKTVETVRDFIWGGSKITADDDCSHEIKSHEIKACALKGKL